MLDSDTAARAVLDAGRELWRYYHAQPHANTNASYYDIRRHFQGVKTTAKGRERMNATKPCCCRIRAIGLDTSFGRDRQLAEKMIEYALIGQVQCVSI